jgi:hypothetical protein
VFLLVDVLIGWQADAKAAEEAAAAAEVVRQAEEQQMIAADEYSRQMTGLCLPWFPWNRTSDVFS